MAGYGDENMTRFDQIGQRFNSRAAHYDNPITAFIGEHELRVIRRMVPTGSLVLDYGCGTGRTTLDHLLRGCQVTAYDISPEMLSLAEKKVKQQNFLAEFTSESQQLSGRRWPIVTCIGVLDYYPNPLPLFTELCKYMEDTGHLIVTWPNALSPLGWLYAIASRFTIPAIPRTPKFIRHSVWKAGFEIFALDYAFPEFAPLGHTFVVGLKQRDLF